MRNQGAGFLVKDVNVMPAIRLDDPEAKVAMLDQEAILAVRQELRRGHGVAVSYAFATPSSDGKAPSFIRGGTYAQYTWRNAYPDHGACIVGWDDDHAVSNFNQGTVTEKTERGPVTYDMAPPGPAPGS